MAERQASCSPAGARRGWARPRPRWNGTARRCCGASSASSGGRSTGRSSSCARRARSCRRCPTASRWSRTRARGAGRCRASPPGSPRSRAHAPAAYASSTDVPLLHPRFVRRVLAALDDDADVVLPEVGGFPQPLAAAYRTALVDVVERLIAEDRMRPAFLFEACPRDAPRRRRAARRPGARGARPRARLRAQPQRARRLRRRARAARRPRSPSASSARCGAAAGVAGDPALVAAATLGEAAAAIGLTLDEHVVAALNGDQITRDPETPLVAGDAVVVPRRRRRRLTATRARTLYSMEQRAVAGGYFGRALVVDLAGRERASRCPCPTRSCARTSAAPASARGSCTELAPPGRRPARRPRRRSRSASRRSSARR